MRFNRRWLAASLTAFALAAVVGGTALAQTASRPDDVDAAEDAAEGDDVPIRDADALERATRAALDHVGEGRVTATEIEDEESYYEVEVTLNDGRQVDVQLDEGFAVVGVDGDHEDSDD